MTTKKTTEKNTEKRDEIVNKKKRCFFITPIGDDNSDIRRRCDGLLDSIIRPALDGYVVKASHNFDAPRNITNHIINEIFNSDLVIADLTGLNPNVMYELAIRHAANKPVIVIVDKSTNLPFDLKDNFAIFYNNDIAEVSILKDKISNISKKIDAGEVNGEDNPIHNALKSSALLEDIGKLDNETIKQMFSQLLTKVENLSANTAREYPSSKILNESYKIPYMMKDFKNIHFEIINLSQKYPDSTYIVQSTFSKTNLADIGVEITHNFETGNSLRIYKIPTFDKLSTNIMLNEIVDHKNFVFYSNGTFKCF